MEILQQVLVLLHLIGFASLFGGFLVQLRTDRPEVNAAMLYGALTSLVTGLALVGMLLWGGEAVSYLRDGIKLFVTLLITILVVMNRRFQSIPKGLLGIIGSLTLINAAVAVLWL